LRPDIRKLEEGDIDGAAFEKNRLEEKQREVRKQKKKKIRLPGHLYGLNLNLIRLLKRNLGHLKGIIGKEIFSKSPDIF